MRRVRVKAPRIRVDSSDGHGVHAVQIQDPGPRTPRLAPSPRALTYC